VTHPIPIWANIDYVLAFCQHVESLDLAWEPSAAWPTPKQHDHQLQCRVFHPTFQPQRLGTTMGRQWLRTKDHSRPEWSSVHVLGPAAAGEDDHSRHSSSGLPVRLEFLPTRMVATVNWLCSWTAAIIRNGVRPIFQIGEQSVAFPASSAVPGGFVLDNYKPHADV